MNNTDSVLSVLPSERGGATLLNCVWAYFLFEGIVLQIIFFRLRCRHERLCEDVIERLKY